MGRGSRFEMRLENPVKIVKVASLSTSGVRKRKAASLIEKPRLKCIRLRSTYATSPSPNYKPYLWSAVNLPFTDDEFLKFLCILLYAGQHRVKQSKEFWTQHAYQSYQYVRNIG